MSALLDREIGFSSAGPLDPPDLLSALYGADGDLFFCLDRADRIVDVQCCDPDSPYRRFLISHGLRFDEILPGEAGNRLVTGILRCRASRLPQVATFQLAVSGPAQAFEARIIPTCFENLFVNVRNTSAQRDAEEAVRLAELKYRSIFEGAVEGIFQSTPEGRYLDANLALATTYGYASPDDLIKCLTDIEQQLYVDSGRREEFAQLLRDHDTVSQFESRIYRKDGEIIWISESARAVRDEEGKLLYYEGTVEDITDRKRSEELLRETNRRLEAALEELRETQRQVIHQERLRVVGQVATGVAHDFNNLLSIITGYAELLSLKFEVGSEIGVYAREISSAAERGTALTRQILAATRREPATPQVIDLAEVVGETNAMLRRLIRTDLELVWQLGTSGAVRVDRGRLSRSVKILRHSTRPAVPEPATEHAEVLSRPYLEQALMNLVVNARDATPGSGRITVQTGWRVVEASEAAQYCAKPCQYAVLSVADTGSGMDEQIKAQIFEPFFSTKPVGKGTGLGLALVQNVVQQAGGFVQLESRLGDGATFRLHFPRVNAAPERETPVVTSLMPAGCETVLLVEDEPRLRDLLAVALSGQGHRVLTAANGVDALRTAEAFPEAIHLLLTDVMMPEMGGRELAERLLAQREDLRVLFMSGYTDDAELKSGNLGAGTLFLQKPFPLQQLLQVIRNTIVHERALIL